MQRHCAEMFSETLKCAKKHGEHQTGSSTVPVQSALIEHMEEPVKVQKLVSVLVI